MGHTLFFIYERLIFWLGLNVLRISASNVLQMFLYIITSVGSPVVIFYSCKPTGNTNTLSLNWLLRYTGKQKNSKIKNISNKRVHTQN